MRHTARLSAAVAVLLLSGCGAAKDGERAAAPAPAGVRELIEPAPPIEAVDEPAAPLALDGVGLDELEVADGAGSGCIVSRGTTGSDERGEWVRNCDELSAEERAEFEEDDRRFREAVEPAAGFPPRTIAKLRLAGDRLLSLSAWRTRAGRLCFATETTTADGGGGGGPGGPCLAYAQSDPACGEQLCLESGGHGVPLLSTLEGVVASNGDALRITLSSGLVKRYPLAGPIVPGFPEYRVFLLDLGRDRFRKLELLARGAAVAEYQLPAEYVRMEDCVEAAGSPEEPSDLDRRSEAFDECMRAGK